MNALRRSPPARRRSAQGGATLLIALITLVAMALVAVAMYRSVDVATLQSGNVALMADQNNKADLCVRRAVTWLSDPTSGLSLNSTADNAAFNYRATQFPPSQLDARYGLPSAMLSNSTSNSWMGSAPDITVPGDSSTRVNCVIERMCTQAGVPQTTFCQMPPVQPSTTGGNADATVTTYPAIRVTTRVDGPRGVSFLQVTLGPRTN